MSSERAFDVAMALVGARVFGRDALTLLRKAAALGVRTGISELRGKLPEGEGR